MSAIDALAKFGALIVNFAAVTYGKHDNNQPLVLDTRNHPVITEAIAPVPSVVSDHRNSAQSWVFEFGNLSQAFGDPPCGWRTQFLKGLCDRVAEFNRPGQVGASLR